ncbi:phosphotransferase [Actinacidiphila alni]|uniref:phosphotransferase n=1 Tax=Actinacidiphila alni TaxID=380248 RepID=UPI003452AAB0
MHELPEDVGEPDLWPALAAWGLAPGRLTYAAVGFGDYHWQAVDVEGRHWFVTVADLTAKAYCGPDAPAACAGLERAMDTAAALRASGLDFVVAPEPAADGRTLHPLPDGRHAVSVFPFEAGTAGDFGEALSAAERGRVLDLLAALHRTAPPAAIPAHRPELPSRPGLDAALGALSRPWSGGPYAEPARELLAAHGAGLRRRLAEFDRLAVTAAGGAPMVTHGEPHPGNVLRRGERRLLVDWDTVALAVPERDLWLVAETAEDLARYADAAGRAADPAALALYRLRWALDDVALSVAEFRGPHAGTRDTAVSWSALSGTVESLTA